MLIISNPVAGVREGPSLISTHVVPILITHNIPHEIIVTNRVGHAGEIAREFILSQGSTQTSPILVSGGDGVIHEVVNAVGLPALDNISSANANIIILPSGTANALYSSLFPTINESFSDPFLDPSLDYKIAHKLRSLLAFLHKREPQPLIVAHTRISAIGREDRDILSVVVTSTSLHASILDTAEGLRDTVPGLERFKVAARMNVKNFYYASATLLPPVSLYNPHTHRFTESTNTRLKGPFSYYLSTVNVDRLEPAFRITPLFSSLPPPMGVMELVVIRPMRVVFNSPEPHEASARITAAVLGAAYQDGAHVNMEDHSSSEPIVEYYRCAGWEWYPEEAVGPCDLVCADGTIERIPQGGTALCRLLENRELVDFRVFV